LGVPPQFIILLENLISHLRGRAFRCKSSPSFIPKQVDSAVGFPLQSLTQFLKQVELYIVMLSVFVSQNLSMKIENNMTKKYRSASRKKMPQRHKGTKKAQRISVREKNNSKTFATFVIRKFAELVIRSRLSLQ